MKYIKTTEHFDYSEVSQINPIRWEICYFNGTSMKVQTGKFKCKDFFNDVVAKYHGTYFRIYGFDNEKLKLNDEGVYVRVTGIVNFAQFAENIELVINSVVEDKITVKKYYRKGALLFIPRWFFENTYKISLVTLLIRLCNYGVVYNSLEEAINSVELDCEGTITSGAKEYVRTRLFNVPDEYKKYWWYMSPVSNSDNPVGSVGWIHNNGVQGWSNYAK